jgi:hypothetical protein
LRKVKNGYDRSSSSLRAARGSLARPRARLCPAEIVDLIAKEVRARSGARAGVTT